MKAGLGTARIGTALIAGAVALPLSLVVAADPAVASNGSTVHGGGSGPLDTDRVDIELSARGQGATAHGRFTIVHHTPDGVFAHLSGDIDCLSIQGSRAIVTGTITEGFDDLGVDPKGERVSLVVHDEHQDVVDVDVSFVSGHHIDACVADPIATVVLDRGQLRVS
jgi:hypothetical protein